MTATTSGKLWYLKRGDTVSGPFPVAVVERNIVLGRVRADDLVSQDCACWTRAGQAPEFEPMAGVVPGPKELSHADERQADRRHTAAVAADPLESGRRGRERRRTEPAEIVRRRALSNRVWQTLGRPRSDSKSVWLSLVIVIFAVVCVSVVTTPPRLESGDCAADPSPRVNWESCSRPAADLRRADMRGAIARNAHLESSDLAGANLVGADLAYADLRQANFELADLASVRLTGANLREANFAHANLRSADLQFADLRSARLLDADLSGALLGNAIWFNGELCRRGSVGVCLIE